jgi:hypothetical protein
MFAIQGAVVPCDADGKNSLSEPENSDVMCGFNPGHKKRFPWEIFISYFKGIFNSIIDSFKATSGMCTTGSYKTAIRDLPNLFLQCVLLLNGYTIAFNKESMGRLVKSSDQRS